MKKYIFTLFLFSLFSFSQQSLNVISVNAVYDGDTFRVDLDCKTDIFCKNIPIRVFGIDTPEMKTKCEEVKELAKQAKNFTKAMLSTGKVITLKNIKRGKYFRIVAEVYVDKKSLSKALIKEGLAVSYDGGKKHQWCEK